MINAVFIVDDFFSNNRIFDKFDKISNRDDCLIPFIKLKELLNSNKIFISTNIDQPEKFIFVVFSEFRENKFLYQKNLNKYLIIFETEIINKENWNLNNHKIFNKIFTWNEDFVDSKKYIKSNIPNNIPINFLIPRNEKKYFCTLIAGNKLVFHKNELYSERIKAIKWFEKNHLDEFDLYGIGWDSGIDRFLIRYLKKNYYMHKIINKIIIPLEKKQFFRKIIKKDFISYKGTIETKNDTLKNYKFSICYENAKGYPGYITEKIFDCFLAGCVPVYLGAPNVTDYIPENTFIDKRKFNSYEKLYEYMKNMTDNEYSKYQKNIENFLNSKEAKKFSAENFAETIVNEILNDLKKKDKK